MTTIALSMMGKRYTFLSKNPNDKVIYSGTIVGFCPLGKTGRYGNGNVTAYNQAVRQADGSVPSDVSNLSMFFVLELDNSNGPYVEYVMAPEWIVEGSFTLLDTSVTVTVAVQDSESADHTGIIEALRDAGYINCTITSVSES